jgi:soluble lytic murein transglycosylase-like protein
MPIYWAAAGLAVLLLMAKGAPTSNPVPGYPAPADVAAVIRTNVSNFRQLSAAQQLRVAGALVHAAAGVGIPLSWLMSTCYRESRFVPWADSGQAYGLCQQVPRYSGHYSDRCWNTARNRVGCSWSVSVRHNLTATQLKSDWEQAARIGARFIRHLYDRHGSVEQAILHYGGTPTEGSPGYLRRWQESEAMIRGWLEPLPVVPIGANAAPVPR